MQTAGMLRGTRAVCFQIFLVSLIGHAHSFPLQLLPSIPGYIPVYIRHGDQPLEDINPALAEAFHEKSNLAKNIRLDDIPGPTDISAAEEEDNAFEGKSKNENIYSVHVRQVEDTAATPSKPEKQGKPSKKNSEVEVPKLLSIYELHDEEERTQNRHRRPEGSSLKLPVLGVLKVSPVSEPVKENPEKPTTQVDSEETKPHDLVESNPNYPDLPSEVPTRQDSVRGFPSLPKTMQAADASTEQPSLPPIKDLSQVSADQDTPASQATGEEVPVKNEPPAHFLANVHKLSPVGRAGDQHNSENDKHDTN